MSLGSHRKKVLARIFHKTYACTPKPYILIIQNPELPSTSLCLCGRRKSAMAVSLKAYSVLC